MKTFKTFENTSKYSQLHGPVEAMNIREGLDIESNLTVTSASGGTTRKLINLRLWRISPLGGEFLISESDMEGLEAGATVDLTLRIKSQICDYKGIVISLLEEGKFGIIVGFRWVSIHQLDNNGNEEVVNKRKHVRWLTNDEFVPTVVSPNPVIFSDMIYFRVLDLSSSGLRLKTSLRNKFIIPGMVFDAVFSFPMVGSLALCFKVIWTKVESTDGKDFLVVGAEIARDNKVAKEIFGQYVHQFSIGGTIAEIRESELKVTSTKNSVNYTWVRTEEEYLNILKLRSKCYTWYTQGDERKYIDMSDKYDAHSRILNAIHKGKTVGSLRINFPSIDHPLEQETYVKMPDYLPANTELVELTRVCTDPDFRKSDLLYNLIKHAIVATVHAKRRYIVGSSPASLLPLYLKMGARDTGLTYDFDDHGVKGIHVFYFDVIGVVSGRDISPAIWNLIGKECLNYLYESKLVDLQASDRFRLVIFNYLSPVLSLINSIFKKV